MPSPDGRLACFVPEYGSYYHFMVESVMGLYRMLRNNDQLEARDCEIWYKGRYVAIVQLFSRHPVRVVEHASQVPDFVATLRHIRPETHEDWRKLMTMRNYLMKRFPGKSVAPGITVIQRRGRRAYADHDELVKRLQVFDMPVREVALETLSLGEQIDLMRNTRALVGAHGAGLTNLMFMPKRSLILQLYPRGFIDRVFHGLSEAFGHTLIEVESPTPSVIGRKPSPPVQKFIDERGWPTRADFRAWNPNRMELGRVLRDVASFSINPELVVGQLRKMVLEKHQNSKP